MGFEIGGGKEIMKACPDCGCILERGVCSNCQEELFIIENQSDGIVEPLSNEFTEKAEEQREHIKHQKEIKVEVKEVGE